MTAPIESGAAGKGRLRNGIVLCALTIGAFAVGLDAYVVLGALDAVMRDLAIAPATVGWIVSSYAFSYALFAPLNAWLFRRWNRRAVLILSVGVFTIGNILCGFAPGFTILIVGRVISAFGAAIFTPAATALATELLPPQRKGFALSLIFGGMTVAQAAGVPATSWIAEVFHWRLSFLAVAACGAVTAGLLSLLLTGVAPAWHEPTGSKGWRAIPGVVYGLLSVTLLIVIAEFTVYSYVSLLLANTTLGGVAVLPAVLFAYGIGAILGNLATGVLTDRVGPTIVLLLAVSIQTALLAALVLLREHAILVIAMAFGWGIVSYMYLVPIQHRLLHHAAGLSNLVLAANSSLVYLGIGTGSWIGGLVIEAAGLPALAWSTTFLGCTALVMAAIFMMRSKI